MLAGRPAAAAGTVPAAPESPPAQAPAVVPATPLGGPAAPGSPAAAQAALIARIRAASPPRPADVHLAPATPGSVRFTVTVPEPQLEPTGDADGSARLTLRGYDMQGDPGSPPLPARVVVVAVPPIGDVTVRGVGSGLATRDNVTIAPALGRDAKGNPRVVRNAAAYGTAGSGVPVAARLLQLTWLRNQRIARIAIQPLAYQPAARRLTVAGRVDVDVQVQPLGSVGAPAEPSDPFEDVYRTTLANYDQGRLWRRPATNTLLALARRLGLKPERALASQPPTTSVLYGHTWVKIAVQQTGFYALNYSTLRNTALFGNNPRGAPFDSLRLFALPGYPELPEASYCDTCDLSEVAIGTIDVTDTSDVVYHGQPDGRFMNNLDTFYFFAQGPSGWSSDYVPSLPDTDYVDNQYELNSYYYLTLYSDASPLPGPPRRIATRTDVRPGGGAAVVHSFPDRVHFEQDNEYWPNASAFGSTLVWEKWFWASMTSGDQFSFTFDLPGADTTQAARFRLRDWGLTDNGIFGGIDCFFLYSYDHYLDVTFNSIAFPEERWDAYTAIRHGAITIDSTGISNGAVTFLRTTGNTLHMVVPNVNTPDCPERVDRSALAWFEIYYQHLLQPHGDSLLFRSPAVPGPYHYDVGPFVSATPPRLFDVTRPDTPVEFKVDTSMWKQGPAGWTLSFEDTGTVLKRYQAIPDSAISIARLDGSHVSDAQPTSLSDNLRGTTNGADYVVIYYDAFQDAAAALAAARTVRLPIVNRQAPFTTKTVPISALYDQFSGGRTDPGAIRAFLRAAFLNWATRPKFVVLLGDASYDFKNILGQAPSGQPGSLIPSFEDEFDSFLSIQEQFATDDWMLSVSDPNGTIPDFYGGRIPADDPQTALAVVNQKVLAYEALAPLGEYRNQVVLLADDDMQLATCDAIGWGHLEQTNELNLFHIPEHEDREYVYLQTYPTGPNYTKPGARADLESDLNAGASIFNYIGHGSPFKLTDESVFIDTDAGTLTNGNKLFAFISASCDVGRFNDPSVTSLGERLFMTATGGAIAVISATGQALSSENSSLANFMYDQIFNRSDLIVGPDTLSGAGKYHVPLSAALLVGKIEAPGTGPINNMKYQLMGDPATVPNLPQLSATLSVSDVDGQPLATLARGQTVAYAGQITDVPGGNPLTLDGTADIFIEDSAPVANTVGNQWDVGCYTHTAEDSANYKFRAGTIYHGDVTLAHGAFSGRFLVPMDATLGTDARLRVYFTGRAPGAAADVDGVGAVPLTLVTGTANPADTQGPQIRLSFVGGAAVVRPDATLTIDLFDDSGIMTTAHSAQNSIIVTLDNNTITRTDVTSSFRYAPNSYQGGQATYTLPGLAVGPHTVSVSAADNLATGITAAEHRSSATLDFTVAEQPALNITHAYLFPNPIRVRGRGAGGAFVIDAPGDSVNTMVRIYTITGHVVRVLKSFTGLGQVQIPWDGRDDEGEPLANGVYLFKVYANTRQADGTSSPTSRANAEGRIVVLNR